MAQLRWFTILVALAGLQWAQSDTLPAKQDFHLFLLAGQSNMAGRGDVEAEDRKPDPRVLMLDRDHRWVPAADPLHFDKPSAGVGLGKSFGIAVAQVDAKITVGLIPCAVGGTAIDTWVPGALDAATETHPWDDCMRRARIALPAGLLKGILWHQGEADANAALAPVYEEKLHTLVARFRRELSVPDVPFIVGQLGQFPDSPWSEARTEVDRAHRNLPSKVTRTAFVSSAGLTHKGDRLHFDAASLRELGRRYAAAYLALK